MTLRLACSGLAQQDGGSVLSAGYTVLEELLARGNQIDFFSLPSYVFPHQLLKQPGFTFIDCSHPRIDQLLKVGSSDYSRNPAWPVVYAAYARRLVDRVREIHRVRPYGAMLFLGQWMPRDLPELPVVSWVQGPPATDARSIRRHRSAVRRYASRMEFAKLTAYGFYREALHRPPFGSTDHIICGSRWSQEMLAVRYRVSTPIDPLPYPIDLETFAPAALPRRPVVAWVGRIVPRKRLDLFLGAAERLIDAGYDLEVCIVGDFPFLAGTRALIDAFPHPERLDYRRSAARSEIRDLLQRAEVLVQPSQEENFGSSVAEALACGTPVVLGPTNGTGDYIDEGGRRFTDYAAEAVADAVAAVLDAQSKGDDRLGAAARAAAERHFDVRKVTDGLESVLDRAIAAHT